MVIDEVKYRDNEKEKVEHIFSSATVMGTSVLSKPILFTKPPNFTMPFYYVKVPVCYCLYPSTLQLTGALKWDTVWASILIGIETMHGHD